MKKYNKNIILQKKKEAYSLFKKSCFSESITLLNQIIIDDQDKDYACFFLLGTAYLHKQKLDLAETNLKKSIDLNPGYYDATHNLGVVYKLKENYLDAINYFQKALESSPKNINTMIQLAECNEKLKSFEIAKNYYLKILELEKNHQQASKGIARIYLKFGYHKQALDCLKKTSGFIRFNDNNFEIIS